MAHFVVANQWDSGSHFNPCMPGRFGVGRLACGLFIVGLFFLQQFGWYPVLSAVLWSACASWGRLRCSPRLCSRMLSLLSSRLVLRFVVAGLSDVAVVVRPGCARRIVLVRRCRCRQWSARPGLCGGPYGPGWPRFVAVGCPLCHLLPVRCVLSWLCVGPSWPCRVGSGCSSCVGPAWYILTLRRPLTWGVSSGGEK